ncbi:hypothetical protein Enr13x_30180 [Stieleria neptunia]|uniref:Uncharacterized protein n=1 Tax=Stieleria neptunia TaxID=2527979 RepID=A0A518HQN8_9BACT|nr:hypothetical protein [Stieleria neptunia]QDV43164.1 hypothetical protein Enr13x_30180 [Stieleria neptunia]
MNHDHEQDADQGAFASLPPHAPPSGPLHSIAICPICGGGLCGIRICTGDDPTEPLTDRGFVMCDECEAVWMQPDVQTEHRYVDAQNSACPVCQAGLWTASRWADRADVQRLGWSDRIDASLDGESGC